MNIITRWLGNKLGKLIRDAEAETAKLVANRCAEIYVEESVPQIPEDVKKYRITLDGSLPKFICDAYMEVGDISNKTFQDFLRKNRPFAKKTKGLKVCWVVKDDKALTVSAWLNTRGAKQKKKNAKA